MQVILVIMGRTLPSITQTVLGQIEDLKTFSLALRHSDQRVFEKFFEVILEHRVPIGNATSLLPMQVLPLAILLEERKRVEELLDEIRNSIEELNRNLNNL